MDNLKEIQSKDEISMASNGEYLFCNGVLVKSKSKSNFIHYKYLFDDQTIIDLYDGNMDRHAAYDKMLQQNCSFVVSLRRNHENECFCLIGGCAEIDKEISYTNFETKIEKNSITGVVSRVLATSTREDRFTIKIDDQYFVLFLNSSGEYYKVEGVGISQAEFEKFFPLDAKNAEKFKNKLEYLIKDKQVNVNYVERAARYNNVESIQILPDSGDPMCKANENETDVIISEKDQEFLKFIDYFIQHPIRII